MSRGCDDEETTSAAWRGSEARLRRAQRVARLGSWELDLASSVMWGSDEAFKIYGLPLAPDNSLPFEIVKAIPLPQDRPRLDRAMAELLEHGTPYEIRFRIRRYDDGAIRYVHSFAEAARDSGGRPIIVTGTIQDVTEHEEASRALEEALRANEERARLLLEQAADAIFLGTPAGVFTGVNEKACELTGYPKEELVGRGFELLFAPDVLAAAPLRYDLIDRGETTINERVLNRKDGTGVLVEMRAKKLSDGTLQAIVRDISERRRLEEQLQLRQRMDSIGTLAGGIAHDFNNILAAIVGYADLLRMTGKRLDPAQQRGVESILKTTRRAADLVRGLQMLSRPDPGGAESFDLYRVAAEVVQVLRETTDRLIAKDLAIAPGRFFIHGSASSFYHALMNLGVNAVQAIEEKGAREGDLVRIEAEEHAVTGRGRFSLPPGSYIHVSVRDTGVGMTPEVRNRVFDPLFTTKEKGERKGQGLGLTMVYNIVVRQHGGMIDIETGPGMGSTFHLYVPRARSDQDGGDAAGSWAPGGDETILVIDDEPEIVDVTREALQRVGYSVLVAPDGQEALRIFRQRNDEIDLVVLDRTLPKLSGERVLEQMRVLRPDVRVVVSSGDPSVSQSSFPGARRILHKPYPPTLLCAVIRDVLDSEE